MDRPNFELMALSVMTEMRSGTIVAMTPGRSLDIIAKYLETAYEAGVRSDHEDLTIALGFALKTALDWVERVSPMEEGSGRVDQNDNKDRLRVLDIGFGALESAKVKP